MAHEPLELRTELAGGNRPARGASETLLALHALPGLPHADADLVPRQLDYLREVRPLFLPPPRTFQRTLYRPGEICQFEVQDGVARHRGLEGEVELLERLAGRP
jgi:hypothetical protein